MTPSPLLKLRSGFHWIYGPIEYAETALYRQQPYYCKWHNRQQEDASPSPWR